MDYAVHGILQARILEWVAFPFSRGSSQPRDQTQVSHIAGGFFTIWATREAQDTGLGSLSLLQQICPTQESFGVSSIAGRFFTNWATREAMDFDTGWEFRGASQGPGINMFWWMLIFSSSLVNTLLLKI